MLIFIKTQLCPVCKLTENAIVPKTRKDARILFCSQCQFLYNRASVQIFWGQDWRRSVTIHESFLPTLGEFRGSLNHQMAAALCLLKFAGSTDGSWNYLARGCPAIFLAKLFHFLKSKASPPKPTHPYTLYSVDVWDTMQAAAAAASSYCWLTWHHSVTAWHPKG